MEFYFKSNISVGRLVTKCDSRLTLCGIDKQKLTPFQNKITNQDPSVSGCDAVPLGVHFTTVIKTLVRLASASF